MCSVLVADDCASLRTALRTILERAGYRVRLAENGRQVLHSIKESCPDLLLLDLLMPEGDGLETMESLKRSAPGIKILAITGGGWVECGDYLKMASILGAHGTLRKPFTEQTLLAKITELLPHQAAAGTYVA